MRFYNLYGAAYHFSCEIYLEDIILNNIIVLVHTIPTTVFGIAIL